MMPRKLTIITELERVLGIPCILENLRLFEISWSDLNRQMPLFERRRTSTVPRRNKNGAVPRKHNKTLPCLKHVNTKLLSHKNTLFKTRCKIEKKMGTIEKTFKTRRSLAEGRLGICDRLPAEAAITVP